MAVEPRYVRTFIVDTDSDECAEVDWDGTYMALAVMDSRLKTDVDDNIITHSQVLPLDIDLNYGYDDTEGYWSRFLVELDNDDIPAGQTTQLVIPLNYYWEAKSNAWKRWQGEDGSMWTTVVGLYTPTFDSVMDDILDTVKVSNDTAANLKVDGSDVTQPISGTVTANAGTNLNTSSLATESSMGKWRGAVSGLSTWKEVDGKPRVSTTPYLYDIGEGNIAAHTPFYKIGYNPVITNVEEAVWSAGGKYPFLKGADMLEAYSDDNTQDIGSILFNTTSTGGSTTTLEDSGVDFTAGATPVAVFDCVILDKGGAVPEWGYVTGVAATTLTIAGGFSEGGTGASRDYIVINKTAYTGAHAIKISYLTTAFAVKEEIVVLNGTTPVNTVNNDFYRINEVVLISAGTLSGSLGNVSVRDASGAPIYAYITAGYTRARQLVYTVPAGLTLYITSFNCSWASPNDTKVQSLRMILRCNQEQTHHFLTGDLFYPIAESMVTNQAITINFDVPLKFPAGVDIYVAGIATNAAGSGPATGVLRGWTE